MSSSCPHLSQDYRKLDLNTQRIVFNYIWCEEQYVYITLWKTNAANIKQISARPITNFSLTPAWMGSGACETSSSWVPHGSMWSPVPDAGAALFNPWVGYEGSLGILLADTLMNAGWIMFDELDGFWLLVWCRKDVKKRHHQSSNWDSFRIDYSTCFLIIVYIYIFIQTHPHTNFWGIWFQPHCDSKRTQSSLGTSTHKPTACHGLRKKQAKGKSVSFRILWHGTQIDFRKTVFAPIDWILILRLSMVVSFHWWLDKGCLPFLVPWAC